MSTAVADRIEVSQIAIDAIVVGQRHRVAADVSELAASIARSGLLHPIVVRPITEPRNGFALVAGANRLAAFSSLGIGGTIAAIVRNFDPIEAELAEIDENLTTNTLTILEQGEHLIRRSEILREMGLRRGPGGHPAATAPPNIPQVTTRDLGKQVGVSDRSVQRYIALANDLPTPIRDLIRGSDVANRTTDLLTLAKMEPDQQQAVATYLAEHKRAGVSSARHALYESTTESPDSADDDSPGDDVGERYDVVTCEVRLVWKEDNSSMRKRIINGEERFYRRESVSREREIEFKIGVEAFQSNGRTFLCNAVGRQLYDNLDGHWPPSVDGVQ